jgi:hypothetical protein
MFRFVGSVIPSCIGKLTSKRVILPLFQKKKDGIFGKSREEKKKRGERNTVKLGKYL